MPVAEDPILEGLRLFNERRFDEAHEVLEELWQAERGPSRRFVQGLLQLCAGFYHFQNGNLRGAADLLARGSDKLREYPGGYLGLDLPAVLGQVAASRERIERMRDGLEPEAPIAFPVVSLPGATAAGASDWPGE